MMRSEKVYILAFNYDHARHHAAICGIPRANWQLVSRVDHLRAIQGCSIVVLPCYRLPVHIGDYREMEHYLRKVQARNYVYRWDGQ